MQSPVRLTSLSVAFGLCCACGSTTTATTEPDAETLIAVDPADFPGAEGCGSAQGFGSFVAELFDVSGRIAQDDEADDSIKEFSVQSSPATACDRAVAFSRVVEYREYMARVATYADSDGDPSTIDVCTVEQTSVAVMRENGECTTTLAAPLATYDCWGWQETTQSSATDASTTNTESTNAGSAGAEPADTAVTEPADAAVTELAITSAASVGKPGVAIEYRTMTLHYCVESER